MVDMVTIEAETLCKSKPIEDVNLEDMLQHPIWIWALDEEEKEGQDETWQKPVLSENVTPSLIEAYILLKADNTDFYVSANLYVKEMTLSAGNIHIWVESKWVNVDSYKDITFPLYLTSIPMIEGNANVKFIVEKKNEGGKLVSKVKKRGFWNRLLSK